MIDRLLERFQQFFSASRKRREGLKKGLSAENDIFHWKQLSFHLYLIQQSNLNGVQIGSYKNSGLRTVSHQTARKHHRKKPIAKHA